MTGKFPRRILVAGGPRVGKTTLARQLAAKHGLPVRHTDDLIGALDWSDASREVATWFDSSDPWIIEGVAVPRALRKWLAQHRLGCPADVVYFRETPRAPLTPGQRTMSQGVAAVWREIRPDVVRRGTTIESF